MARKYKLLEVENLNTSFKIDAGKVLSVNGVSFTLEKGKILGIVGESGSGKSVTAYSILGILDKNGKVDNGKIIYKGTDLLKISEREMRDIRGNKISIIFQDAMTSLNPTWTIGNQLREAILTHAKDPIKEATSELANAIKSDHQRIAAMKKGLQNHPERDYLRKDLETIEKKLMDDEKAYEAKKKEAIATYNALKKEKDQEYRDNLPRLNKVIKYAFNTHFKKYFDLGPRVSRKDIMSEEKAQEIYNKMRIKQDVYFKQIKRVNYAKNNFQGNEPGATEAENKKIIRDSVKNEKAVLRNAKREYKASIKEVRRYVIKRMIEERYGPRKERRNDIYKAFKARRDFRNECIACYKETKYSANKKALHMLEEVGITEPEKRLKQYPFELSGGMLQRCMIAMALVQKPDILIADEPTTALDVTIQAQILDLLKKLQKEYGMAIIIITHDLGVVAQMCDEVDIMYAGRIVERGTTDDIFYNPQHEYTKGLIKSMPKIDSDGKRLEPIQGNPVDLFCLPKGCAFSSRCDQCMQICIDQYPEEVNYNDEGHAASCWKMIKKLQEEGKIDIVNGVPEGKPLIYNGAVIYNQKKKKKGDKAHA